MGQAGVTVPVERLVRMRKKVLGAGVLAVLVLVGVRQLLLGADLSFWVRANIPTLIFVLVMLLGDVQQELKRLIDSAEDNIDVPSPKEGATSAP